MTPPQAYSLAEFARRLHSSHRLVSGAISERCIASIEQALLKMGIRDALVTGTEVQLNFHGYTKATIKLSSIEGYIP